MRAWSGVAAAALGVLLARGAGRTWAADTPPAPAATAAAPAPSLVVSDRAPLGCCCLVHEATPGAKPGCSYGLSEDKCREAVQRLPGVRSTWASGKCPGP